MSCQKDDVSAEKLLSEKKQGATKRFENCLSFHPVFVPP
jgi:hypothetical protein